MQYILSLLFIVLQISLYSQCPYLGPDQLLPSNTQSTTLFADTSNCIEYPKEILDYDVFEIPYTQIENNGVESSFPYAIGPIDIGFNFSFYENTYSQLNIYRNGRISFQPITTVGWNYAPPIPYQSIDSPINSILLTGPYSTNSSDGGSVKYETQGVTPYRKFIITYEVPYWTNQWLCPEIYKFHIILYETTNIIEQFIDSKPYFCNNPNTLCIQGIQNLHGNKATTVPGRNGTGWEAFEEAWRYTPQETKYIPELEWYEVGNSNLLGVSEEIEITPSINGAYYTCHPKYENGYVTSNLDTIFVKVISPLNITPPIYEEFSIEGYYIPNAFTPDGDEHNNTWGPVFSRGFKVENYHLEIYNKWGNKIWESYDYNIKWDGNNYLEDVYVWKMNLNEKSFYGHITLIR